MFSQSVDKKYEICVAKCDMKVAKKYNKEYQIVMN